MKKSKNIQEEITIENWILLVLANVSESYGINLGNWYFTKRPKELDFMYDEFTKTIVSLEKDGIIKRASKVVGHHCLTENGRKKLIQFKRELSKGDIDHYYNVISKFPEIEIRDRIETLEGFLINSLFYVALYLLLVKLPQFSNTINNPFVALILTSIVIGLLLFSLFNTLKKMSKVAFFWGISFQRDTWPGFREWIWNHKNILSYISALFIVSVIVVFIIYIIRSIGIPFEWIVGSILIGMIPSIIFNLNKIKKLVKQKLS